MVNFLTAFISATPLAGKANTQFLSSSSSVTCYKHNSTVHELCKSRRVNATTSVPMMVVGSSNEVNVVSHPPAQKPPPALFEAAATLGEFKSKLPTWKILLLGIVAGAYIAIGGFLALRVGGSIPGLLESNAGIQRLILGLIGLPTGLLMVLTTGGELFTGNTMLLTSAVLTKRATMTNLLRNWIFSFIGNFIGSLLIVKLILLSGIGVAPSIVGMATLKTSVPFMQMFWRGVLCNWLVCLSIYIANGASDLSGKFLGVLLPISAFVAMGMEHSVANMFFIPMGMRSGANIGVKALLVNNILPVTLGNIVAGVFFVATVYYLAFGKKKSA